MACDQDAGAKSGAGALLWWFIGAAGLYFLPFFAITIDEKLLKTFWFAHHLPAWVGEVMRTIYPFYRFFNG